LQSRTLTVSAFAPQDQCATQEEKVDHYMTKLREAEAALVEKQSSFTAEIEGLKRLSELYKRYFEDATAKITELEQHDSVMRETHTNVLNALREKCAQQLSEVETTAEKERAEHSTRVKDLEDQLRAAQSQVSARSAVPLVENANSASPATSAMAIENFDGIGITEMYDRVVQTEKELFAERSKRREVELYMQQILKDIESKAPIIASQRRDYHRVVESHTALTRRLDQVVIENAELKQTVKTFTQRVTQAEETALVVVEHNADLGRQVQHLLKRSLGVEGGSAARIEMDTDTPGGVISQYLVTFDDVQELQQKNAELLRVVRKLSKEQEQAHSRLLLTDGDGAGSSSAEGAGDSQAALQAALEELNNMREARQRTEEMVVVLAQQRDMYRSMAEGDPSVFRGTSPAAKSPGGGLFASPTAGQRASSSSEAAADSAEQQGNALWNSAAVRELQSKLTQAEDEARRLKERIARLEELEQLLNDNLDKVRKEATAARLEAAQGTSEARFQRERAER
jgi:nucleoprotein TPR